MLATKECLLIGHGRGKTRATITLDDGTVIEVQQVDGAAPSPFLFVTRIVSPLGPTGALWTFMEDPARLVAFQEVWRLYQELANDSRINRVPSRIEKVVKRKLNEDILALRLEGRDSDLVAVGEKVSIHIVFFGYGHITLGTVTKIDVH